MQIHHSLAGPFLRLKWNAVARPLGHLWAPRLTNGRTRGRLVPFSETQYRGLLGSAPTIRLLSTSSSENNSGAGWKKGDPLLPKTLLNTALLSAMGIEPEDAPAFLGQLIDKRYKRWADLRTIKSEEQAIKLVGDDQAGSKIWDFVQEKKKELAGAQAVPMIDHNMTKFINDLKDAVIVKRDAASDSQSQGFKLASNVESQIRHGEIVYEERKVEEQDPDPDDGTPPTKICVIKLPNSIPGTGDQITPDLLCFFQSDLDLIQLAASKSSTRVVLVGNPGIGKSMWQWKLILLMIRPELWKILKGVFDETNSMKILPSTKIVIESDFPLQGYTRVIRIVAADTASVIAIASEAPVVESYALQPLFLNARDTSDTLVLWEPAESRRPIPYSFEKFRLIATVSPDITRYKDITKQPETLKIYAPCPTPGELLAFGKVVFEVTGDPLFREANIKERIAEFGPFTRAVIPGSKDTLESYRANRSIALQWLTIEDLQKYSLLEDTRDTDVSHYVLRTVVNRDIKESYVKPKFKPTSLTIQDELARKAGVRALDELRVIVSNIAENTQRNGDMFEFYIRTLMSNQNTSFESYPLIKQTEREKLRLEPEEFTSSTQRFDVLKLRAMYDIPKFEAMEPNLIYTSSYRQHPVADLVWKHRVTGSSNVVPDTLIIVQVSLSEKHAHSIRTYMKFLFERVGVVSLRDGMTLAKDRRKKESAPLPSQVEFNHPVKYYYVTHWRNKDVFAGGVELSSFFDDVTGNKREISRFLTHVTMRSCIVLNPTSRKNPVSEETPLP